MVVVSVLTFYSDDQSSNPADVCNFYCKNTRKERNKMQKGREMTQIFKIHLKSLTNYLTDGFKNDSDLYCDRCRQ